MLSDVLLDPLYLSGGNTTYDSLLTGTPIVTLPDAFQCSRITSACYQQMGMMDCVAQDAKSYRDLAIAIATNPEFRNQLKQKIRHASHSLYENKDSIYELEHIFMQITHPLQQHSHHPDG